ncbi:MAG: sulfatase [Lentisphaeraceae bacterium]|nr:sulfatase [Lentisphaeraceae bacterium]
MLKTLVFLAILLSCTLSAQNSKPNFVFVLADDCSYFDTEVYGGQAKTPNMMKLASQGMKFNKCFQSAPMCSPTRHNIYTGQYPFKTGAYPNHTFAKEGTKSIVHYLKPLGYRVALSGKKHINPKSVFPFEYLGKGNNPDFKEVEKFIKDCQQNSTPFCLFLTSNEPHSPWTLGDASKYKPETLKLPKTWIDTPTTRETYSRYLAEITYFDSQVGEALNLLEKYKLSDNTLFIATTEQGSSFPFAKWTCYDAGIQTGFIARWPGKIKVNSQSNALIEYCDVTPTFVEAAGGKPDAVIDGKSLLPLFSGNASEHKKYVYSEMTTKGITNGSPHFGIRSIRSDKFKYIWNFTPEVKFTNAATMVKIKTGEGNVWAEWLEKAQTNSDAADKVKRYHHRPEEELYAVDKDSNEWINLANNPEFKEIKNELRSELLNWMKLTGDKGQQSELDAYLHQTKGRKKKR